MTQERRGPPPLPAPRRAPRGPAMRRVGSPASGVPEWAPPVLAGARRPAGVVVSDNAADGPNPERPSASSGGPSEDRAAGRSGARPPARTGKPPARSGKAPARSGKPPARSGKRRLAPASRRLVPASRRLVPASRRGRARHRGPAPRVTRDRTARRARPGRPTAMSAIRDARPAAAPSDPRRRGARPSRDRSRGNRSRRARRTLTDPALTRPAQIDPALIDRALTTGRTGVRVRMGPTPRGARPATDRVPPTAPPALTRIARPRGSADRRRIARIARPPRIVARSRTGRVPVTGDLQGATGEHPRAIAARRSDRRADRDRPARRDRRDEPSALGGDLSAGLFGPGGRPQQPPRPPRDAPDKPRGPRRHDGAGSGAPRPRDRGDRPGRTDRADPAGRTRRPDGAGSPRGADRPWRFDPPGTHRERGAPEREPVGGSRRRVEDVGEVWPELPEWASAEELEPEIRRDLRSLSKDNADFVGGHLVAAGTLADDDPELGLDARQGGAGQGWPRRGRPGDRRPRGVPRRRVGRGHRRAACCAPDGRRARAISPFSRTVSGRWVIPSGQSSCPGRQRRRAWTRPPRGSWRSSPPAPGRTWASWTPRWRSSGSWPPPTRPAARRPRGLRVRRPPRARGAAREAIAWFVRAADADVDDDTDAGDRLAALTGTGGADDS